MCLQFFYRIKEGFLCEKTRERRVVACQIRKNGNVPRPRHREVPRTALGKERLLPGHWLWVAVGACRWQGRLDKWRGRKEARKEHGK
jgi:hypothetical protein